MGKWSDLQSPGKHSVALIDPPWKYYGQQDKVGAAENHYRTLPDEDIYDFPVRSFLARPGVLFVWATCPKLDVAIEAIDRWGLHYRGVAFVWVKTKADGKTPLRAQGPRPSFVKPLTELVLVASTRAKGRPLRLASAAIVQTVLAPKEEHSRKPREVVRRIDRLYPATKKVAIFARGKRPAKDWDVWGDEADNDGRVCVDPQSVS